MAEGWEQRFPSTAVVFGYERDADRVISSTLRSPHELVQTKECFRQTLPHWAPDAVDEAIGLQAMRAEAFFSRGGQVVQYLSHRVLGRVLKCDAQRDLMLERAKSGLLQVHTFPDTQGVRDITLFLRQGEDPPFAVYCEAPPTTIEAERTEPRHGYIESDEGRQLILSATGYFEALARISVNVTDDLIN